MLLEWLKAVDTQKAKTILIRYSLVMIIIHFVSILLFNVIYQETINPISVIAWGFHYWAIKQSDFKGAYFLAVFVLFLGFLAVILTPVGYLQLITLVDVGIGYLVWLFPLLLTKQLLQRQKNEESSVVDLKTAGKTRTTEVRSATKGSEAISPKKITPHNFKPEIPISNETKKQSAIEDLKAKYSLGHLAIQYRKDAKAGWLQMRELPVKYQLMYLKNLTENPKADIESLLDSLNKLCHTEDNPFENETQNTHYRHLKKTSERAASEYKKIIHALGEDVDSEEIAKILNNKYGLFGRLIATYEDNLIRSLKYGWIPDSHFRFISRDEFDKFRLLKSLDNLPENQLWCSFILYLYQETGKPLPKEIHEF